MVLDERVQSLCIILYLFSFFWGFDLKKKQKVKKGMGGMQKPFKRYSHVKGKTWGGGGASNQHKMMEGWEWRMGRAFM